ncbi:MAG: sigma-54-dependent Fis family transcriptional regulator, partial [Cohaesibacteraceae bacterium]|nr:sigma-54-dependent Fis family transcriptional regulator [Cohaesibacteraceae bacterium]
MSHSILIIDDDPIQRRLLQEAVSRLGYNAILATGGEEGLAKLSGLEAKRISLVILDLVMPDIDGMAVLERMAAQGFEHPVIVQTSKGGIDTVVNAMRAGAFDFVVKPASHERLQISIRNALKVNALEGEIARFKKSRSGTLTFRDIITQSPMMARVLKLGDRAAASNIPILIEGESGVGKELIARAIQGTSERRSKPFITVNCGAIPENLVESTLFGHEKGAFTGATEKHGGKFLEAHGGTLFLDEVGELPLNAQVKLLRALQENEIDPVGGKKPVKVDFRLISATNRDLIQLVKDGKFREDLYYRLNVFPIRVPPLRDRREDIPELARHFLARFSAEEGKRLLTGFDERALDILSQFDWPGNIRQLENTIFRAVVLCDRNRLTLEEFPQLLPQNQMEHADPSIHPSNQISIGSCNGDFTLDEILINAPKLLKEFLNIKKTE